MDTGTKEFLDYEARALLARLARMRSFALHESMVPAASLAPLAATSIERHMHLARREVRQMAERYLKWLHEHGEAVSATEAQRRFTLLRLRFGSFLSRFDMFADVLTQRSESDTGVWLSGLDVVAADALSLPGYYESPPAICYLDCGVGAAIRRARTRLPGGTQNPVAIIRVPRERMVGTGIASSLIHEVGHQAAAMLNLVTSLRTSLRERERDALASHPWPYWSRWISEIVADFWSVARIGICSTLGLIGVVSLPRPFVFRISASDPHPAPWIRVHLSCGMGRLLYPHPQWDALATMWNSLYPLEDAPPAARTVFDALLSSMPEFLAMLATHQSSALKGHTLASVMSTEQRQPSRLQALFSRWHVDPREMYREQPSLVFAALGQARADGRIHAQEESTLLAKLLTHWALRSTLNISERCVPLSTMRALAPTV